MIFVVALMMVVGLGFAGMEVSNIARAYVAGEAQYSKAQKEAVIELMRYAQTGSEDDYSKFQTSLGVLHGDRAARLALEARPVDLRRATEGFLQGRNAPQDVPALIVGFRLFHTWPPFAEAVRDWRTADAQFIRLERLGEQIRREVRAYPGAMASPTQLSEVARLDRLATVSERRFSDQMGRVARRAIALAHLAVGLLSLMIGVVGVMIGWRIQGVLVQASAQLAEGKRLAEEASQAKGDFLASMSHEIRTPLTGIIGFTDLLRKVDGLPARAKTFADRIDTAGQTLLVVVNDILDFSKLDAGCIELEPQAFELEAFVAETIALLSAQAEHKGLELSADLGADLPRAVFADPARLRQILLNLLNNAIKFTVRGRVTVAVRHDGETLRIAVVDTGMGIPADRLHRLFQRFSQADGSVSRQFGGTGLGLAISKNLAEQMGGGIGVETREGVGSTFWFTVTAPVAEAPKTHVSLDAIADACDAARILVVDDTEINRELISAMLAPFGHSLVLACGGAEGVEAARCMPFDLILMDLQMPGVDGLAATRAIRATSECNRRTPILAISANVLPAHVTSCRAAGMDDHIAKPINARELLTKIAAWTGATVQAEAIPAE